MLIKNAYTTVDNATKLFAVHVHGPKVLSFDPTDESSTQNFCFQGFVTLS